MYLDIFRYIHIAICGLFLISKRPYICILLQNQRKKWRIYKQLQHLLVNVHLKCSNNLRHNYRTIQSDSSSSKVLPNFSPPILKKQETLTKLHVTIRSSSTSLIASDGIKYIVSKFENWQIRIIYKVSKQIWIQKKKKEIKRPI